MFATIIVTYDCTHGYDTLVAYRYTLIADYLNLTINKRVAYF